MKKYVIKTGYNMVVLIIAFMTIGTLVPEVVYAMDEEVPKIEKPAENNELEIEELELNSEDNQSSEDFKKETDEKQPINHSLKEVTPEELEASEDEQVDDSAENQGSPQLFSIEAPIETKVGWVEENQNRYYYENGEPITSWKEIEGKRYYFDETGAELKTITLEIDNEKYRFDSSGAMIKGWHGDSKNNWYYYSLKTGAMATGWEK